MCKVSQLFGSMVFSDAVMRERLPHDTYRAMKRAMAEGVSMDRAIADVVAGAMKDWALEKGATHFTHWFQPMTGITAEKHDSFIRPTGDGRVLMEFSGKELIKGEPDASSFPSGGLRATFEARGYTAWDPTSPAFVKDSTLYIPTVFYSYTGEVLDKKAPLLRSMEALNQAALKILAILGDTSIRRVTATVGSEQEYFLVDKELFLRRPDLLYTGRTLFGARAPKGQELEDHYFGAIRPRVKEFMADLDQELWKLGIPAKTEHNEVAPAQHELAPVFTDANTAADHNQLTMELLKKVADRHGLACLLHEKPFAGVNGSGKHNNWSLSTDTGENLLDPGRSPSDNIRFLLFLCAVIAGVDDYQDLLRVSAATAGNDHRLGASEAPPAIVSIFLGDELTGVLEAIQKGTSFAGAPGALMETGVSVLPHFPKDNTDRNRTSPFAFTGNKFEFRMPGSSLSVAGPNIVLNTVVADQLEEFAGKLEGASDLTAAVTALVKETMDRHSRIIFNGDGYSSSWPVEAARRGLTNLPSAAQALPHFRSQKNLDLFARHRIFSQAELSSRCGIMLENYCKTVRIEALTMLDMARREILPAVTRYIREVSEAATARMAAAPGASCEMDADLIGRLASLRDDLYRGAGALEKAIAGAAEHEGEEEGLALYYRNTVVTAMARLREPADQLELLVGKECWPFPTYGDLLFGV
jgi:glutamine synthetase